MPIFIIRGISRILLAIGFAFTVKQKEVSRESLNIAFKQEKSPREIEEIVRKCFFNLGQGIIEMIYYLSHPKEVADKITFEGREYLDEALKKGNGVIAVTAHFGNFPLMMLYCAQLGYNVSSIIRPARDEKIEKFLLQKRTEAGLNTVYAVPRRECVAQSLKVLRANEILFVPLDQNFGANSGVFVDFFGQKAATATGPVVFATRTNSPILPLFIIREEGNCHKIIVEPPMEMEEKGNEKDTLYYNTAKITKIIEQYIRRYPHEWGWMHRRWKSKQLEEKAVLHKGGGHP